ncbi:MAG: endo alpha-1,4 polygalactosaminidase [Solirubrobacteraceae bacterium]
MDFVHGVPPAKTASTRERFDISRPHSNPADGPVTIACALDGGAYSSTCARGRSFLTPMLRIGRHRASVKASSRAGTSTSSYSWTVVPMPSPRPCASCFLPPHLDSAGHPMSWDWQLQGRLVYRRVDMFDIDGFANSAAVVAGIHARAGLTFAHERAVCYLSLGSWESFRPDAGAWPAAVLGRPLSGYPNERWVDVRQLPALMEVIDARLRMCAAKGFDGVEVDNIDGWNNRSGFPLTPQDAEAWLAAIANAAHALNMFVLWKNDPYLASFGARYFDGALSEACFEYGECTAGRLDGTTFFPGLTCNTSSLRCGVAQFASAGKWVGEVEYKWGVLGEDGVVCDPGQSCTLRTSQGNFTEVPYSTFCSDVYGALRFSAWRASQSNVLNGTQSYYCWA